MDVLFPVPYGFSAFLFQHRLSSIVREWSDSISSSVHEMLIVISTIGVMIKATSL